MRPKDLAEVEKTSRNRDVADLYRFAGLDPARDGHGAASRLRDWVTGEASSVCDSNGDQRLVVVRTGRTVHGISRLLVSLMRSGCRGSACVDEVARRCLFRKKPIRGPYCQE